MKRFIKGAESVGCILVGSVESKNKFDRAQEEMEAMADDVYERFLVEPEFALFLVAAKQTCYGWGCYTSLER